MTRFRVGLFGLLALVGAALASPVTAIATADPPAETGTIDGANFIIQMPASWNGTLVLYSHGYRAPGSPKDPQDAGDKTTGDWLVANHYAIAGSSYSQNGWALKEAFHDQIALLDHFQAKHGKPKRTIAWGHSLGGIITAGLIQLNPERFAAALPMCGVVAGGPAVWNQGLDAEFAFKTLAGPAASGLQLVHITNPGANLSLAESVALAEQSTPQGRAHLALVAAIGDTPGWYDPASPEPAANDYTTRETNQYKWDANIDFPFLFALRAELEARAGGNPSWNTGVDYEHQLNISINKAEVVALYKQAGLDLKADLEKLENTKRVAAEAPALAYLEKYIVFNGELEQPVLTMHTIGDGLVLPQDEQAYASVVRSTGDSSLLRQTYVHRAGHCSFTPGETVSAFKTLVHRLDTGHWGDSTDASKMNHVASQLPASFNPAGPSFVSFTPSVFMRPFDARNLEEEDGGHSDVAV